MRRWLVRAALVSLLFAALPFVIALPNFLAAPLPNIDYKAMYRAHAEAILPRDSLGEAGEARESLSVAIRKYKEAEQTYRERTASEDYPAGKFFNFYFKSMCEVNLGPLDGTPEEVHGQLLALESTGYFEEAARLKNLPTWSPAYTPGELMLEARSKDLLGARLVAGVALCGAAIQLDSGDVASARDSLDVAIAVRRYALQQPHAAAQLIGYSITSQLDAFLTQRWGCAVEPADLELLRSVAIRLDEPPPLAFAMEGERLFFLEYLQSLYNEMPPRCLSMPDFSGWLIRGVRPHADAVKHLNEYFDAVVAWSRASADAEDQARARVTHAISELPPMLPMRGSWHWTLKFADQRERHVRDLARLRVMVESNPSDF